MLMETRADAFLALPGGWGTLEELLEILTLAHLEVLRKPVVILNQDGYYDDLLRFCQKIVEEKFMHATIHGKYSVARSVDEIFPLIENWSPATETWLSRFTVTVLAPVFWSDSVASASRVCTASAASKSDFFMECKSCQCL